MLKVFSLLQSAVIGQNIVVLIIKKSIRLKVSSDFVVCYERNFSVKGK